MAGLGLPINIRVKTHKDFLIRVRPTSPTRSLASLIRWFEPIKHPTRMALFGLACRYTRKAISPRPRYGVIFIL